MNYVILVCAALCATVGRGQVAFVEELSIGTELQNEIVEKQSNRKDQKILRNVFGATTFGSIVAFKAFNPDGAGILSMSEEAIMAMDALLISGIALVATQQVLNNNKHKINRLIQKRDKYFEEHGLELDAEGKVRLVQP